MSKTQVTISQSGKTAAVVKAINPGQTLIVQAKEGARYELQDLAQAKKGGIPGAKFKRVGKDLHILLENEDQANLVIENYYSVFTEGVNAVVGQAENGVLYEYSTTAGQVGGMAEQAGAVSASLSAQIVNLSPVATPGTGLGSMMSVGAGLAGLAAAASGGKAKAQDLVIQGEVVAGPVHGGITVYAYDDQGQLLGQTVVDAQGQWRIAVPLRGDYKGVVLVKVEDTNNEESNYKDEVTGQDKSMGTTLRVMAAQTEANVTQVGEQRVLTISVSPVTELAVRQAGINLTDTKAPSAEQAQKFNTEVANALGLEGVDITGSAVATNSSAFKSEDGLNSAEKYGILLTKLSGLDKINGGSIDTSLQQLGAKLSETTESKALLEQGRQEALKALQNNVEGAVFVENTLLNRQLLGEVLITQQALDKDGKLVIEGTALPGSTVNVTTATGTQQVIANAQGTFTLTTEQNLSQLNAPLSVVGQDGMGQSATNSIALKPEITQASSVTPEAIGTLGAEQVSGISTQALGGMTGAQIAALSPEAFAALTPAQLAALSVDAIAGLTAAQLATLTPEEKAVLGSDHVVPFSAMTPAQFAALTAAQLAAMSSTDVAALSSEIIGSLTAAQVGAFSTAGIKGLSPDDLDALTEAAVGGITPAQLASMGGAEIAALGTDIANLSSATMGVMTPAQFAALTMGQVSALGGDDVAALSEAVIASMGAAQVAALSTSAFAGLSQGGLAALSAQGVSGMTPAQVDTLSPAEVTALGTDMANLSAAAMGTLTPAQFEGLTTSQIAALGSEDVDALSNAVIASLNAAQVAALSTTGIEGLSTADLDALSSAAVSGITAAQVPTLSPAEVAALGTDVANMNAAAMGALTPAQFAGLTTAQIAALGSEDVAALSNAVIASLTAAQVAALSTTGIEGLSTADLDALSSEAVSGITAAQVATLSPAEMAALGTDVANMNATAVGALTPEQFAGLTTAQIAALGSEDVSALSNAVVTSLTAAQVAALSTTGIEGLSTDDLDALSSEAVSGITAEQVATLSPAELAALGTDVANMNAGAVAALTPEQFAGLTTAQIAALGSEDVSALSNAVISSLTAAQVAALSTTGIEGLSTDDLGALSSEAVSGITPAQVPTLSPAEMAALGTDIANMNAGAVATLTSAQVAALTTEQIAALGSEDVAALTSEALQGLTSAQVAALTTAAFGALGTDDLGALTSEAVAGITAAQVATLETPEEVTALGTAAIANNGTTNNTLSSVSGTGVTGNTIYLYDNTGTNLVGTTTVVNGAWTVSVAGLSNVLGGSNAFAAVQMDPAGNTSVMSNLWTVNAGANLVPNGDFDTNNFTTSLPYYPSSIDYVATAFTFNTYPVAPTGPVAPLVRSGGDTVVAVGGSTITWGVDSIQLDPVPLLPSDTFWNTTLAVLGVDQIISGSVNGASGLLTVYESQGFTVEAGQTYQLRLNYHSNDWAAQVLNVIVDGVSMPLTARLGYGQTTVTTGTLTASYTAAETKSISIKITGDNTGNNGAGGDFNLDDISFKLATTPADGSLVAGEHMGGTPAVDNLSYGGGLVNAQGGDDVITVTGTDLRTRLLAGGLIQGGEGYDTLVLAAGTSLDMNALRAVQTVESLQQLEAITLQGNSNLTLNANDVLSLGGEVVDGKVRLVINKTSTDQVTLDNLDLNPGHEGTWVSSGTTTLNGYAYNVLNHSTTQAQVLLTVPGPDQEVSFSSMTKDSGVAGSNVDWLTNDGSAGRLISGTLSAPLAADQTLKVYANGLEIGNAVVSGTNWQITDTTGYSANWTYTAKVVNAQNSSGPIATQEVTADFVEAAPVITAVTDSATAAIANSGTTNNSLSSVSGTGVTGNTIYLYDNTGTNLVGTTTVVNGAWTVSVAGLSNVLGGSNAFSAVQMDAAGNTSVMSNVWTVKAGANLVPNGDFDNYSGFTSGLPQQTTIDWFNSGFQISGPSSSTQERNPQPLTRTGGALVSTAGGSSINWAVDSYQYIVPNSTIYWDTMAVLLGKDSVMFATAHSNSGLVTVYQSGTVRAANNAGGTADQAVAITVTDGVDIGQATVNLGVGFGTLSAPKDIDGRTYYFWNSASANGGWDRGYNNFVEGIFNQDVNGNVKPAGIEGPNDIYRYATINGVRLALPTAGIQTDENGYVQGVVNGNMRNAGTAVSSGAPYNSKYSDMLAVWDAYNGTETDIVNAATAHPSTANNVRYYWTATPVSVTGTPNGQHVMVDFLTGDTAGRADNLIFNVMVEVLSPQAGLAMPVITLANGQGKLINPVEVEGKWYYSWDRNGNGVLTGYNYDPDYFNAGELNTLFNKDIFGNTNAVGADMNEVFRYTTLKDANGADVWMAVPTYGGMVNASGYADIVDWQNTQTNFGANTSVNAYGTINTVYDDFAAIADAGGVPPLGWTNTYYKTSSVFMVNGAVRADQHLGYLNGDFYAITDSGSNSGAFALEMVKPNLAPVLADTALSFGTASASSLPVGAVGVLVSDLMGGVTDGDAGASKGVAIIDIQYGGTLWYSTNGGANWLMSKDVTAQKALLLGADADNRIFFQPGKNMTGTVNDAITFRAWDRSRGEEGQFLGNNTTVNGGASPFSAATETLSVNVGTPPVVLDLNRDGSLSYSHVAMDVNGDGRLDHTAWAGAQDGVLVWDKHADGVVRDASQYAFTQYGGNTDLQGLAAGFDSNHDGVFDAADAKFAEFAVWQDANQNGVSEAGEVRSLADVGVASIHLSSDGVTSTPADGVSEAGRTTAITTDGSSMLVADAAFEFSALSYRVNAEGDLSLLGEQMSLDLSSLVAAHGALHSVDLSGTGANSLKISLSDLLSLGEQQPLRVLGDADDSVVLDAAQWTASGSAQAEGHSYAVYAASNGQQLWLEQQIHMA